MEKKCLFVFMIFLMIYLSSSTSSEDDKLKEMFEKAFSSIVPVNGSEDDSYY